MLHPLFFKQLQRNNNGAWLTKEANVSSAQHSHWGSIKFNDYKPTQKKLRIKNSASTELQLSYFFNCAGFTFVQSLGFWRHYPLAAKPNKLYCFFPSSSWKNSSGSHQPTLIFLSFSEHGSLDQVHPFSHPRPSRNLCFLSNSDASLPIPWHLKSIIRIGHAMHYLQDLFHSSGWKKSQTFYTAQEKAL